MGTSVAVATVLGTLLGLATRNGHGRMAQLAGYLWLCVTASLAFFIRFLARRVFRHRREEESYQHGGSASACPPVPIAVAGKPEEEEEGAKEEREAPVFQFKFSYQIPEQSVNRREVQQGSSSGEDGRSSMVTSISKYRFFAEEDRRGLVEAPRAMTLRVQESFIDSDGMVWNSTEELDGKLKGRFSSVKLSRQADADIRVAEELDGELKNRLLLVKFSRRSDLDAGHAVHEEEQGHKSLNPDNLSRTDLSEEFNQLPDAADAPAGGQHFPMPAGDFRRFNSDSDFESRSDGYSVKDLIVDFASDGFFSERDFEVEVDRARLSGLRGEGAYVEFEQKTRATQLLSSADSVGSSEDFDGEGLGPLENMKSWHKEIKLEGLPNSISSSDLQDDNIEIVRSSAEELDRELKSRFSLVKHSRQADLDVGVSEELDRKLKCRLLSVKFCRPYDSDVGGAVHEVQGHRILYHDNLSAADVCQELELLDITLPHQADALAGDLGEFNSGSESESGSDGYSVKDLVLDFDSDGLFSETEFVAEVGKAGSLDVDGREDDVEFKQKSKATPLPTLLDSVVGSKDSDVEDTELREHMKNCTEIKLENLPNSISSSVHDVLSNGGLCAAELESEQLHREEIDQKEEINDSKCTDELGSITSHVSLDTEHLVKVQPERILLEAGGGGSDQFGVKESESSESRGPDGIQLLNSCSLHKESVDFGIKNQNMKNSNISNQVLSEAPPTWDSKSKHVSGEEIGDVAEAEENSDEQEQDLEGPQESEETHFSEKSEELSMEELVELEELESLSEHQDLIDQLKMDLRKARATGLPTILEESESPRPAEGLKPWKLEARFLREDPKDELHKFYKSYRERMRKFDVLNHQKMYAIGFLQMKDPLQSMGTQKPIIPTIASILSQNLWRRKSRIGPSGKFVKELQNDLETVYVGQSCLSWEFLRWQYEISQVLLGSNTHNSRQYNQVAEEFQQFQVLIQRFLENEPFQGPRVPNYAKNRCVLQRLLQIPVIREDCFKDKADQRRKKDAITGEQLEYIMEDSIRIFWEFVKSDKYETPLIMKGLFGTPVELQDPKDLEFMVDIQTNLKQKQKKLKDVLRTGNCLVKKFKKLQHGRSNQDDLFFSQVDLKLVSRVLKMTRITTDQLVWCHTKLSKIYFVDRKLLREPSFFLFPC